MRPVIVDDYYLLLMSNESILDFLFPDDNSSTISFRAWIFDMPVKLIETCEWSLLTLTYLLGSNNALWVIQKLGLRYWTC